MGKLLGLYDQTTKGLNAGTDFIPLTVLRLILFWEFWQAGVEKLDGSNWFGDIPWASWQVGFPFPFDLLSLNVNWYASMGGEIVFAVLLLLGLFTRFAAFSLIIIDVVAMVSVHWPANWTSLAELWQGYVITSQGYGNYKLPLLFIILLLPLVFQGGGRLSLDWVLLKLTKRDDGKLSQDPALVTACASFVLFVCTIYFFTVIGALFFLIGLVSLVKYIKSGSAKVMS